MGQIASLSNGLRENEIYELDLGKYQNLMDEEISVILEVLAQNNKSVRLLKICNPKAGKLSAIQLARVMKNCKNIKELQIEDSKNLFLHSTLQTMDQIFQGSLKRIALVNCDLDDSFLEFIIQSNHFTVNFINLSGNLFSRDAIGRFLSNLSTRNISTRILFSIFCAESLEYILNLSMHLEGVNMSYNSLFGILEVNMVKKCDEILQKKNEDEERNSVVANDLKERLEEAEEEDNVCESGNGKDDDNVKDDILWDVISSCESEYMCGSEFILV
jgi:hypothetical protein